MLHHVTPVLKAKEPRISLINSYVSRNVFREDLTKYATFEECDPKHITSLEFARHKAWRATGLMRYIIDGIPFPSHRKQGQEEESEHELKEHKRLLCDILEKATHELTNARRLIAGEVTDAIGYYDEVKKQQSEKTIVHGAKDNPFFLVNKSKQ